MVTNAQWNVEVLVIYCTIPTFLLGGNFLFFIDTVTNYHQGKVLDLQALPEFHTYVQVHENHNKCILTPVENKLVDNTYLI